MSEMHPIFKTITSGLFPGLPVIDINTGKELVPPPGGDGPELRLGEAMLPPLRDPHEATSNIYDGPPTEQDEVFWERSKTLRDDFFRVRSELAAMTVRAERFALAFIKASEALSDARSTVESITSFDEDAWKKIGVDVADHVREIRRVEDKLVKVEVDTDDMIEDDDWKFITATLEKAKAAKDVKS